MNSRSARGKRFAQLTFAARRAARARASVEIALRATVAERWRRVPIRARARSSGEREERSALTQAETTCHVRFIIQPHFVHHSAVETDMKPVPERVRM
jgi:hypothetical protein